MNPREVYMMWANRLDINEDVANNTWDDPPTDEQLGSSRLDIELTMAQQLYAISQIYSKERSLRDWPAWRRYARRNIDLLELMVDHDLLLNKRDLRTAYIILGGIAMTTPGPGRSVERYLYPNPGGLLRGHLRDLYFAWCSEMNVGLKDAIQTWYEPPVPELDYDPERNILQKSLAQQIYLVWRVVTDELELDEYWPGWVQYAGRDLAFLGLMVDTGVVDEDTVRNSAELRVAAGNQVLRYLDGAIDLNGDLVGIPLGARVGMKGPSSSSSQPSSSAPGGDATGIGASVGKATRKLLEQSVAESNAAKLQAHLIELTVPQLLQVPEHYTDSAAGVAVASERFWKEYMQARNWEPSATVQDGTIERVVVSAQAGYLPERQPNANAFIIMALSTRRDFHKECLDQPRHVLEAFWTQCGKLSSAQRKVLTGWARPAVHAKSQFSAPTLYQLLALEWTLTELNLLLPEEKTASSWRLNVSELFLRATAVTYDAAVVDARLLATLYSFGLDPQQFSATPTDITLWWRAAIAQVADRLGVAADDYALQQRLLALAWSGGVVQAPIALRVLAPLSNAGYDPNNAEDEQFREQFFSNVAQLSQRAGQTTTATRLLIKEAVMQWPRFWRDYTRTVRDAERKFLELWRNPKHRALVEQTLRLHMKHISSAEEESTLKRRREARDLYSKEATEYCEAADKLSKDSACSIQSSFAQRRTHSRAGMQTNRPPVDYYAWGFSNPRWHRYWYRGRWWHPPHNLWLRASMDTAHHRRRRV